MNWYKMVWDTAYSGTERVEYMQFDSTDEAEQYLNEGVREHGENYAYLEHGWDQDWEDEEQEEMYYEACAENSYCDQLTEEEVAELIEDGEIDGE
jgi:hypothetical protein